MHRRIFREFDDICRRRNLGGRILEVGAVPSANSLLTLPALGAATEKIGLNMLGASQYRDIRIIEANGNDMHMFDDDSFDAVLCNATLEHDRYFWKSLAEIRRVTKPGGVVVIGVPGYADLWLERALRRVCGAAQRIPLIGRWLQFPYGPTLTLRVHNEPGDYYRFTVRTLHEVFFEAMDDVQVKAIMTPPRIVGSAVKPARG